MTSTRPEDAPQGQAQDARSLFEAQRAASRRELAASLADRRASLDALRRLVGENAAAFADAIARDYGNRSRHETELMEVVPALSAIAHARQQLPRWMRPERRPTALTFKPATSWIRYEPLGVVGIIAPWNYPLILTAGPLVDVLAAGNRALIKPSELTPAFSELLKALVADYFPPEQVAVVTGDSEVAAAFSALPFDHLMFTGSTAVGRKVMQAAAANLTPVTLELGGKSPAIVCTDYPIAKAAGSIALGKFLNAGQTCIAPDYALVPAALAREFAEAVMAKARKSYPKIADNKDYSSIISPRHHKRLAEAVAAARAAGAVVLTHGEEGAGEEGAGEKAGEGQKMAPTVVMGAAATSLLMREEIFGPVLPVVPYDDLDAALAEIRGGERPLALYCFSNDKSTQERVLDGAISGGVTLNGTLLHISQNSLPFGGVGASGLGSYHGLEGFRRFSHARAVHRIGPFSAFEKLGPPWGWLAGFTIGRMKGRIAGKARR